MEVKLRTLPRQVAGVLANRIASGLISSGLAPSEQQISSEFGVSRAVAREALKILASLDMVEISQGRRVSLRPKEEWDYLSPLLIDWLPPDHVRKLLHELYVARLIFEPAIAAEAARRMTDANLAYLADLLERMAAQSDDPDAYLELDLDFHMEICRATGNRILERFMYSSRWWQIVGRRISNREPQATKIATQKHQRIYDALAARDFEAAEAAMRDHLTNTMRTMMKSNDFGDLTPE